MAQAANSNIMKFLTVFVAAMPEACKTQFGISVKPGSPHPMDWAAFKSKTAVVAKIEVLSDGLSGYVILGFSKETFLAGASSVFGEPFSEIDAGNMDFGGEILNIVYGVAKAKLKDQHGLPVLPAIPKVSLPSELEAANLSAPSIEIAYESDWGQFWCAFCLLEGKSKAA